MCPPCLAAGGAGTGRAEPLQLQAGRTGVRLLRKYTSAATLQWHGHNVMPWQLALATGRPSSAGCCNRAAVDAAQPRRGVIMCTPSFRSASPSAHEDAAVASWRCGRSCTCGTLACQRCNMSNKLTEPQRGGCPGVGLVLHEAAAVCVGDGMSRARLRDDGQAYSWVLVLLWSQRPPFCGERVRP
jgi:hypothetical protein